MLLGKPPVPLRQQFTSRPTPPLDSEGLFAISLTNICLLIIIKLESTPYLMV